MKYKKLFLIQYFVLLFTLNLNGQPQQNLFTQYKFHRLNETHGLTNNVINDIIQDTLGQIWIATEEGLFRYQGFDFQRFTKDPNNSNYLHNNYVGALYLDKDNDVWIMTDDGVGKYSYKTDVITRFMPDELYGRITSMVIDEEGILYFGRNDGGIWRVENDSVSLLGLYDSLTKIDFGKIGFFNLKLSGNRIWASVSDMGIVSFTIPDRSINYFSPKEIANKEKLNCFATYLDKGDSKSIWIGTDEGVYSLRIDDFGDRIDNVLSHELPADDYLSIYIDAQRGLWLGSRQNGLYTLQKQEDGSYYVVSHFTPSIDDYGISHRTVNKIFQERNGFFWLGTHNGGVNVFYPDGEAVRTVTQQVHNSASSLSYHNVWGIGESKEGLIWVGTDGKGISRLDPKSGEIRNNVIPELENKAVLCVLETDSKVWIGTYGDGAYLYDKELKMIKSYHSGSKNSQLRVNDIRCFYETQGGTIYVGTNQGGLYRYNEKADQLQLVKGVPSLDIRAITSTTEDNLWLGTYSEGLIKINLQSELAEKAGVSERDQGHNRDIIFDIYNDGKRLWIATRHHGLDVFDIQSETFIEIPSLGEINRQAISGVEMDDNRNLWITTSTGIIFFNPTDNIIKQFGSKDGFQSGHFNFGSIFLSAEGFIVAGGINGMNLFYPEDLVSEPIGSEIILNQFKLFNNMANPANSGIYPEGKSIFLTDQVELDHSDNIFSIYFSLPGFTTHGKNEFIYKLQGYDEEWQPGTESNVGTYRNVSPGRYTFRVKSLQNDEERELDVIISPPLWKTWPAYFLYTAVLFLIVWRINRFSNSRIVLKQKLEFEQELREKEHTIMQEKLRFYTNFSHELKTPLTLIQGPLHDLMKVIRDPQQQQYLNLIQKNTSILLKFIKRMLEFRKIEMNKTILNIGKHDLKILAQEEAESFGYLAKEKGVKLGFYCENELNIWVDLEKIQIVMNNLLSNAFKFTPAGKTINFGVFHDDSHLMVEVKDEGIGISTEEVNNIFSPFFQASNSYGSGGTGIGLALCKSFVELHLGTISVESKLGGGTRFLVRIPKDKSQLESKEYVRIVQSEAVEADDYVSIEHLSSGDSSKIPAHSEKLILVVDDNKDIAQYVKSLLEGDFSVMEASNGLEAFEKAVKNTPDLIISDMMMPGMDGFEFCKKVKENISTSHVPVIMLTAKDSNHDKINGYEVGADDYITKPFVSELLIARVNNLLKNRELLELKYEANDLIDPESHQNSREVEFVLKAESIILEKLNHSELSVPDLCHELGMSQTSLYRKIKSLTGVSIQTFIKRIRIKRAAQLLLSEDWTVSEVAFSLEFSDLKYFRKCFKDQFGVTPSEYKNASMAQREAVRTGPVELNI